MNIRPGRPKGGVTDAADRIVAAAQQLFAEHGYAGTTVRAVASHAGCDPALIAYHFGSKAGLFSHVMTLAVDPATVLAKALPGPREEIGPRLIAFILHAWDQPEIGGPLTALVSTAMSDPQVMGAFREYLEREVMGRLVEYLGGPDATSQANGLITLVVGVIFARYVVQIPTIATQPTTDYLAAVAPAAQRTTQRPDHRKHRPS